MSAGPHDSVAAAHERHAAHATPPPACSGHSRAGEWRGGVRGEGPVWRESLSEDRDNGEGVGDRLKGTATQELLDAVIKP